MSYLEFIRRNVRWLLAGAVLTMASTFGQTYFITLFGAQIRRDFGLSNGDFGLIYMVVTLASALTLMQVGQLADIMRMKTLGLISLAGLAVACGLMSVAGSWVFLALVIYLLRLGGQGMLSHVAMTAMARWFNRFRGRALAFAAMGHAAGEAALPGFAILAAGQMGWRGSWVLAAIVIVVMIVPVFFVLTRRERPAGETAETVSSEHDGDGKYHWSRKQVIRDPLFYLLLSATLAPSFVITSTFFHQGYLIESKGWTLAIWAGFYPFFALSSIVFSLLGGWATDRWSARQMLPVYMLPMALAVVVLAYGSSIASGLFAMVAIGATTGMGQTVSSALWAELYGTRYLGSIKAMTASGAVFSSAIGPGVTGILLDKGASLSSLFVSMAVYTCLISMVFLFLVKYLMRSRQPLAA